MAISACMIVRDEEKLLGRCLDSFRGAWDELVIVDTGSKDRTEEIARSHGARVQRFTACLGEDGRMRDFALARNHGVDLATGDYILWMDADDVLQPGGVERIRAAAARGVAALQVTIRWNKDSWLQTRLFKNLPQNRFVGRIHEYPRISGKAEKDREVLVQHLPDKTGKEGSTERNLRLLELEVREDPANLRALFHLGNALRLSKRYDEAILRYTQYLAIGSSFHSEKYMCAQYLAACLFLQGKWREAIDAGWRALRIDPRYAETHCLIADCYGELREYTYSRQWYRSALACGAPPPDAVLFVDLSKYGDYPKRGVEICDRKLAPKEGKGAAEAKAAAEAAAAPDTAPRHPASADPRDAGASGEGSSIVSRGETQAEPRAVPPQERDGRKVVVVPRTEQ
jgi:glycosyltransferase involved in cell wall biosynthesis